MKDKFNDPAKGQFLFCQAKEGALQAVRTIKEFLIVRQEGKRS